ncbi:hypothetical protein E1212_13910 [Jiangella ureilytica]|uniref:Bacterial spore germination immunoglobulin-like domain-containing protein n=1 Tax=Jiangella ureilytica TaxID=2530374 RepID=A0A4R4RNY2_9ACTN|nr:hypothetical protein [Jiangella ureilytica]TDC50839.1 hypothetical protein E1212_13910 [Jiangella ureilytica]
MRRITGCLPLAAVLLVLAGCGDDSDGGSAAETSEPTAEASEQPGPTQEPTEEPAADDDASCAADGPPQVTVTDPGAEPRSVMELSPTAGDTVELDMRILSESTQTLDGEAQPPQQIPPMIFGLAVTVDEVTDEQISMSVVYDRAEFESDDPQLQATMESMVGLTSTVTTNRSGVFIDGTIDTTGVDPALGAAIGQMGAQLEQLAMPLPTDPVGVGAVWDVTTAIDSNGVVFCSTTTYRLTEFDGDAYAFETEVTQQAQPTTLEQGTATIEVLEGTGTGSGTSSGSLSFPMAVSGSSTGSNSILLLVEDGSDQGEIGTDVSLEMQISARE